MEKFEYLWQYNITSQRATELGADGWDLVAVTCIQKGYSEETRYFFKRRVVE